ncbi:MAG: hypothetical protein ABS78_07045 [Phenylobacterium sp. SCN 70-31]|nr:MAG: hypothetical protein ABS78_07045 [Phenylobacterium sp. SCN 70-31]
MSTPPETDGRNAVAQEAKPYHKGNVPALLMAAAERVLQTENVEDVSARRLCREVGVTSANFYNHYPSLDYLLLEIAAKYFEGRTRERRRLLKRRLPREEAMIVAAQSMVEFGIRHPQILRLTFGQIRDPSINPNFVRASDEGFRILVQIVQGEDVYTPDDLELAHRRCQPTYGFMAFMYGVAYLLTREVIANPEGTRAARRRFVEDLTRSVIRGV